MRDRKPRGPFKYKNRHFEREQKMSKNVFETKKKGVKGNRQRVDTFERSVSAVGKVAWEIEKRGMVFFAFQRRIDLSGKVFCKLECLIKVATRVSWSNWERAFQFRFGRALDRPGSLDAARWAEGVVCATTNSNEDALS